MAAIRVWPTQSNHAADITGPEIAALMAAEGDALWNGVISQVGSVAGTVNIITGVCTPPLTADPADGQTFRLKPSGNNTVAGVTINLDARGAITLKDVDGNALVADDIVSGRPITFFRNGPSGNYRLTGPTQRALIAALAASVAASSTGWEQFGDTTVSVAVSQIEHTFTAGAYSKILMMMSGISSSTGTVQLVTTLRSAGGAIVTNTSTGYLVSPATISSGDTLTCQVEAFIDIVSSTKQHGLALTGFGFDSSGNNYLAPINAAGRSATAPDRIRVAFSSGNIDAGRIMTYGLKV